MKMIPDLLWKEIEMVIPARKSMLGRPPLPSRQVLEGVFYVLKTGIQWKYLPGEFGAPSTIHGRFRSWTKEGVFEKIMEKAKKFYLQSNHKNFNWYAEDTCSCKAPFAIEGGRNPTDRGKRGMKKSIIVDFNGAPLAVSVGPANHHDSKFLGKTIENLPDVNSDTLKILAADSAFDSKCLRKYCKERNIVLLAATNLRRNKKKKKYKPSCRWIVERTFGWLSWYRGLKICWTKTTESFLAFLIIAASVQLFRMGGIFG